MACLVFFSPGGGREGRAGNSFPLLLCEAKGRTRVDGEMQRFKLDGLRPCVPSAETTAAHPARSATEGSPALCA